MSPLIFLFSLLFPLITAHTPALRINISPSSVIPLNQVITFDAIAYATAPNCTIISYTWSTISSQSSITYTNTTSPTTIVSGFTSYGSYIFMMTIKDCGNRVVTLKVPVTVVGGTYDIARVRVAIDNYGAFAVNGVSTPVNSFVDGATLDTNMTGIKAGDVFSIWGANVGEYGINGGNPTAIIATVTWRGYDWNTNNMTWKCVGYNITQVTGSTSWMMPGFNDGEMPLAIEQGYNDNTTVWYQVNGKKLIQVDDQAQFIWYQNTNIRVVNNYTKAFCRSVFNPPVEISTGYTMLQTAGFVLPVTAAPTTAAPTGAINIATLAPTTAAPTTATPTTATTRPPTTVTPTTAAPSTVAPSSAAPTTKAPTSVTPSTAAPTTKVPTTTAATTTTTTTTTTATPTTSTATTRAPTTATPTTSGTATTKPPTATTTAPTTATPTVSGTTTKTPTTVTPTTKSPATTSPTTKMPTTNTPTTQTTTATPTTPDVIIISDAPSSSSSSASNSNDGVVSSTGGQIIGGTTTTPPIINAGQQTTSSSTPSSSSSGINIIFIIIPIVVVLVIVASVIGYRYYKRHYISSPIEAFNGAQKLTGADTAV